MDYNVFQVAFIMIITVLSFHSCNNNGLPKIITNSIDMEFVLIPAGDFLMGSPDSVGLENEHPLHEVKISKSFYMGKYPVTVAQFRSFVEATGYQTDGEKRGGAWVFTDSGNWERKPDGNWKNPYFSQTDDHPVVCITWYDAKAFAEWLSNKEGKTYRLPTEAEFEYALRARSNTTYHFGEDFEEYSNYGWPQEKTEGGWPSHPVGQKLPNAFGLYDMIGNAYQWCEDWYVEDYYRNSPVVDPKGPESGEYKINRGGMGIHAKWLRSAFRDFLPPTDDYSNQTFRLVLEIDREF